MSDSDAVLGRVVFGTSRGLFAIGTGVLAGAAESADAFELRAADPRRSLVPALDRPILLRRALRLSTGGHVDLIAVANGASDLEKRPGFLGYGIAVGYGDHDAYQQAMGLLWEEFRPAFQHYAQGNRFREGATPYPVPGAGRSAAPSLTDAGKSAPPILLTLPDWWTHPEFVTDLLDVSARWSGREAASVWIGGDARAGSVAATPDLIDRMSEETETRAEAERKTEDAALLELKGVHLGQDHLARRKIQRLEDHVRLQDREIKVLKRQLLTLSTPGIGAVGSVVEPEPRMGRIFGNRWLWAGVAAVGVLGTLAWGTSYLLRGEDEVAEVEQPRMTVTRVPDAESPPANPKPPADPKSWPGGVSPAFNSRPSDRAAASFPTQATSPSQ